MKLKYIFTALLLYAAIPGVYADGPAMPGSNLLPTIDPQARQTLAAMVNTYQGIQMGEYADEETIAATGDTSVISSQDVSSHFTVALRRGDGIFLTSTDAKGEKVTVHAFQKGNDQFNPRFLVFTTDNRFPGLYTKDTVTDYQEGLAHSFRRVGLSTFGAGVMFSERDIGSLLLEPAFDELQLGKPLVVDKVTCDSVTIKIDNKRGNNTLTLSIGQNDHLLHRLIVTHTQGAQTTTVTENNTRIRTTGWPPFPSMFPSSYFQYAPPPGYRLVNSFPSPIPPVVKPSATLDKTPKTDK